MFLETLQPFAISLLIGLGVGIERERQTQEGEGAMGIRTFGLVALSGAVAGHIAAPALTSGLVLLLAAMLTVGYLRAAALPISTARDVGLTTEVAASLVFALGYLAVSERLIAGVLGIVVATMLYSRRILHRFSREFLRPADIAAALTLAVFGFIVVPVLPDQTIDPWSLVNPRRMALVMLLIAGIEFGGYMVERLAGAKISALSTGFFGGLASSTAVFLTIARLSKSDGTRLWTSVGAGLAAVAATLLLFVAIVTTTSPALFVTTCVPVLMSAVVAATGAYAATRKATCTSVGGAGSSSPLNIRGTLKLSALIFGLLGLTAIVRAQLGVDAVGVVSFFSGLFELHATVLATATLHQLAKLTTVEATQTLLVAALASVISKIAIIWTVGARRFAAFMSVALALVVAVGFGSFLLITKINW